MRTYEDTCIFHFPCFSQACTILSNFVPDLQLTGYFVIQPDLLR